MDDNSGREFSDLRKSQDDLGVSLNALPGLHLESHTSELSESAKRSYHISTIFNLADTLDDAPLKNDEELTNNLRNLAQYDVGVFSDITQFVGEGATFNVRRSLFPAGRNVVFKSRVFDVGHDRSKSFMEKVEATLLELRILAHTPLRQHPNIVQLLLVGWQGDAFDRDFKWPVLVVEYADRGTLLDFFENEQTVDTGTKLGIISDVVSGLRALHDCLIVHGDLKLSNVLVFSKEGGSVTAKLSDFGGALLDNPDLFIEPTGTPPWTAPEYKTVRSRQQLLLSDVYALGLLAWRVALDGANPFTNIELLEASTTQETAFAAILKLKKEDKLSGIAKQSIHEFQRDLDHELVDTIIEATLKAVPEERNLKMVEAALQESRIGAESGVDEHDDSVSSREGSSEGSQEIQEPEFSLSLGGLSFENTTRALREPVLHAFEHTAEYDNDPERRIGAASILARMYLGSDDFGLEQNVDKGLAYLLKAAVGGSLEDAALVLRFHKAFDTEVPTQYTPDLAQWLLIAGSTGSMTALEDLERFEYFEELSEARKQLKTRYCGFGDEIFEFEEEALLKLADPFGPEGIEYIQSELSLGERHSQDLRPYLLRLASAYGCSGAIRYLIQELGAVVNDATEFGHRPLLFAARAGHAEALITLLELGADPRFGDDGNDTPLHWLSSFENDVGAVLDKLVQHGADVNAQAGPFPLDGDLHYAETEYVSGTPLHRAICRNNQIAVRKLLLAGADPNLPAQDDPEKTSTALATLLHYPEILQLCLDFEGNQSKRGENKLNTPSGQSLLTLWTKGGSIHKIQIGRLIRHGDKWQSRAKETFSVLLKAGIGSHLADLPGEPGCTALFYACRYQPHILEVLVENGADVDLDRVSQRYSNDPFYDLDQTIKHRPLFETILFGKSRNALKLLELGANPCAGENEELPLSALYACASASLQDLDLAEELRVRGVGVDEGPEHYETPFCCAVRGGCYVLADYLWRNGANVNILSSRGLLWASTRRQTLLGRLLRNNGSSSIAGLQFLFTNNETHRVDFVVEPALNQTAFHYLANLDGDAQDSSTTSRALQLCDAYFDPDARMLNMQTLPHIDGDGSAEARGGNTALHLAVMHANFEVVAFLLNKQVDTSIKNEMGMIALDMAALEYPTFEQRFNPRPVPLSLERQLKTARIRREGIHQLLTKATPCGVNLEILEAFLL